MRNVIAGLTLLATLAACSKGDNGATDSAGGGVGATTTPAAAPLPAPPPSTTMSDAGVVAKFTVADSGEIKLARLAQTKATNPEVKSYARMLVTDHSAHLRELAALKQKASSSAEWKSSDTLSTATTPDKQAAEDAFTQFNAMTKGAEFDTAFVNHMVMDHEKVLSEAQSAQPQNADLKALLDKTVPTLQKHLDKAKELQTKLK